MANWFDGLGYGEIEERIREGTAPGSGERFGFVTVPSGFLTRALNRHGIPRSGDATMRETAETTLTRAEDETTREPTDTRYSVFCATAPTHEFYGCLVGYSVTHHHFAAGSESCFCGKSARPLPVPRSLEELLDEAALQAVHLGIGAITVWVDGGGPGGRTVYPLGEETTSQLLRRVLLVALGEGERGRDDRPDDCEGDDVRPGRRDPER